MNTKDRKKIAETLLLVIILGFLTFLVPQSIGLGAGGFDSADALLKNSFYLSGAVFLFLTLLAIIYSLIDKKGDEKYGSSVFFNSIGKFPSMKIFRKLNSVQLLLGSFILFSIFGLFSAMTGQSFLVTGIGTIEQQFTPIGQMIYSVLLVPGSENMGLMLVLSVATIILGLLARKYEWSKTNYAIYVIASSIVLSGVYWVINHLLRYAGEDLSIAGVITFGVTMGVLTVASGSWIPAWVLHFTNNLFLKLKIFYDSDVIISTTVIILIILSYLLYRVTKNKNRKENER
ncbi:MAG: CPBP family glutamic-type intramembrane protease [Promethearchaeia archaeon]